MLSAAFHRSVFLPVATLPWGRATIVVPGELAGLTVMFQTLEETFWWLKWAPWVMTRSSSGEKYQRTSPSALPGSPVTS